MVDDNDSADVLRKGLIASGFAVIPYSNASDALEDIREHPDYFCAVISDVRMSDMTGFELARRLKGISANVKVILMSGYDMTAEAFAKVLPATKVDDFIKRPATIEQVKGVLLKHIANTKRINA